MTATNVDKFQHPKTTDALIGYGLIIGELAGIITFRNMVTGQIATDLVMITGITAVMTTFISYFYCLHKFDRYE